MSYVSIVNTLDMVVYKINIIINSIITTRFNRIDPSPPQIPQTIASSFIEY